MALYPAVVGDGTGSFLAPPVYEFSEEELPTEARPLEIAEREEVITEPTEEPKEEDPTDLPVDE